MRGGAQEELVEIPRDAFKNWQVLMLNGNPYEIDNLPLVRAITQGVFVREDFIVRHQDGKDHICDGIACPILENEKIIGGIVFFLDVTERKAIEASLKKSDERLKLALDSVSDAVWDWRVDTGEVYFSSRWYTMLGFEPYELPQEFGTWRTLLHPDDLSSSEATVFQHLESANSFEIEFRMRTKDNQWRWILARGKTVETDGQGKAVRMLGTHVDITERKKMEDHIQKAQKMESIGSLAGGIAHDFNNILFPIVGLSEMLVEDLPPGSPENENAREILKAGKRASDLVKQILAFSRKSVHMLSPTRIQFVMKEVIKLMRSTIPADIEIHHEFQSDCGLILADSTQLHQIGMNLITNAYHAVESIGGGYIHVKIKEVRVSQEREHDNLNPGEYAVLSVSDNGLGIASQDLSRIFDPYFTTKEQGKGTGLGLSVVYGIVKESKGEIRVKSTVGKGTVFKVYFPLMNTAAYIPDGFDADDFQTGTEHVLLVDDEVPIVNLVKQMLERLGYKVSEKTGSLEALAAFRAHPRGYDIVISDMAMPNMSGEKLAKEILSIRPDIPVIICTGFSNRLDDNAIKKMGIKGLLMKPIVKSEMAKIIRKALDEVKSET